MAEGQNPTFMQLEEQWASKVENKDQEASCILWGWLETFFQVCSMHTYSPSMGFTGDCKIFAKSDRFLVMYTHIQKAQYSKTTYITHLEGSDWWTWFVSPYVVHSTLIAFHHILYYLPKCCPLPWQGVKTTIRLASGHQLLQNLLWIETLNTGTCKTCWNLVLLNNI